VPTQSSRTQQQQHTTHEKQHWIIAHSAAVPSATSLHRGCSLCASTADTHHCSRRSSSRCWWRPFVVAGGGRHELLPEAVHRGRRCASQERAQGRQLPALKALGGAGLLGFWHGGWTTASSDANNCWGHVELEMGEQLHVTTQGGGAKRRSRGQAGCCLLSCCCCYCANWTRVQLKISLFSLSDHSVMCKTI
jgi:hypothetical protein